MNSVVKNPALALADVWQRDFPLQPEPYAAVGAPVDLSQHEVIELMQALADQGVLARIGATVRPNTAGASTLAAMAVPDDRLNDVAALVNGHAAVNHNYQRDHEINLWFVVTAANRGDVIWTLNDIVRETGLEVLDLPLERAYHIDLGFNLAGNRKPTKTCSPSIAAHEVDRDDRSLLAALEDGLDFVQRPYAEVAGRLGWSEDDVLSRLNSLIECGVVTRFGCILRHRRLGYRANAMAVWDVPDDRVDAIAGKLAARDEVTLCYRRSRRLPVWPFNLFAMVHGQARETVTGQIAEAAHATGLDNYPSSVLFSTRCFKQSAARMAPLMKGAA